MPRGIGIVADQFLHQRRRQRGHGLAAIERAEPRVDEAFCQSPSGLPKAGLVCASTTAPAIAGIVRQQLLHDHAADRMADENRPDRADLLQEILQAHRPELAMLTVGSGAEPP